MEAITAMLPIMKIPTTASATGQRSGLVQKLVVFVLTLSPAINLKSQCWLYRKNQHQEVCCYIDACHGVVRSLEVVALWTWETWQPCVGWIGTLESLVK
jgi:hypothetical protein